MNTFATTLMCACMALAGASASAQDAMKSGSTAKDGLMKKDVTMQECKDHIAMEKKDGMKKDEASQQMDKTCAAMLKDHGGMAKDDAMKKDASGMKK